MSKKKGDLKYLNLMSQNLNFGMFLIVYRRNEKYSDFVEKIHEIKKESGK